VSQQNNTLSHPHLSHMPERQGQPALYGRATLQQQLRFSRRDAVGTLLVAKRASQPAKGRRREWDEHPVRAGSGKSVGVNRQNTRLKGRVQVKLKRTLLDLWPVVELRRHGHRGRLGGGNPCLDALLFRPGWRERERDRPSNSCADNRCTDQQSD